MSTRRKAPTQMATPTMAPGDVVLLSLVLGENCQYVWGSGRDRGGGAGNKGEPGTVPVASSQTWVKPEIRCAADRLSLAAVVWCMMHGPWGLYTASMNFEQTVLN